MNNTLKDKQSASPLGKGFKNYMFGTEQTMNSGQSSSNIDLMEKFKLAITREQVFSMKFQGMPVAEDLMFTSLPAFSPTGMPKRLPATPLNLLKYEKYLTSLQKYL